MHQEGDIMSKPILHRIYFYTRDSRREIARVLAYDYDHVIQLIRSEFIDPQWVDRFEEYDWGLEAIVCDPSECKELMKECDSCLLHCGLWKRGSECPLIEEDEPCGSCMSPAYEGFTIEEYEEYSNEDLRHHTIYGTNEFYYIDPQGTVYKAPDWSPALKQAWQHSPQHGVAMLILQTIKDHPQLTGAFDPELIKDSMEKVKELKLT